MKVVIGIDSFKGSVTSHQAGDAAADGVRQVEPGADITVLAVADGGEGTLDALATHLDATEVQAECVDAVGRPRPVRYLFDPTSRTAVVETAEAIGLWQVSPVDPGTPARASSFGLGLALRDALARGATRVVVPLGGSSCTDGGTGLVLALGGVLRDALGHEIGYEPATNPLLAGPVSVTLPRVDAELIGFTDVGNPLTGPLGAARVFGPQKGALPDMVEELEHRQRRWARALESACGHGVDAVPGAGAAGGLGAAIVALGGRLRSGFEAIAEETGIASAFAGADLVITGEGRLDTQSALGKVPYGMAALGRASGALVVALVGSVLEDSDDAPRRAAAFDAILPIHSSPRTLEEAMEPATTLAELSRTAREATRLIRAARAGRTARS